MLSCSQCGKRQVRSGEKCAGCGTLITTAMPKESSNTYRPSWLNGKTESGSKKSELPESARRLSKRQIKQEKEQNAVRSESSGEVVFLEEEAYIDGRFIPTGRSGNRLEPKGSQEMAPFVTPTASKQQQSDDHITTQVPATTYPSGATGQQTSNPESNNVSGYRHKKEEIPALDTFADLFVAPTPTEHSATTSQNTPEAKIAASKSASVGSNPTVWVPVTPTTGEEKPSHNSTTSIESGYDRTETLQRGHKPAAFDASTFLDRSLDPSSGLPVQKAVRRRPRSRYWLLGISMLATVAGAFLYFFSGGSTPALPTLPDFSTNQPQGETTPDVISSFGAPLRAAEAKATGRSINQLDASLFPLSCTPERNSASGYAYSIATEGVARGEVSALATAGAVRSCLKDRVAYLFDATSSLKVSIESFDAANGLVLLRVPAPLPGQPIATNNNGSDRQTGVFVDGKPTFLTSVESGSFPGAPQLDAEGNLVAILGDARTPIAIETFCQSLLSC
jgi:hypothetical protein